MNDKEFRDTKRRVEGLVEKWRHALWLSQWNLQMTFLREPPDDMQAEGGYATYMDVEPRWEYLSAIIRFNMPTLAPLSDDELARHIIHELLHCLVCEMRAWTPNRRQHEERVVSQLTKAIISVETCGWNDGKADLRKKQKAEAAKAKE